MQYDLKGYVYFARHPRADIVKIGFSTRPRVRVRQLSYRGKYGKFQLLGFFEGTGRTEVETHQSFDHARLRLREGTEFFRYSVIRHSIDALLAVRVSEGARS